MKSFLKNIFKDNTKFKKVNIKSRTRKFQVNHEKGINEILKFWKSVGSLSDKQYKKIKAAGSRPGDLYGLNKIDKAIVDVCPPFRHILSAVGTPIYKIAKFLLTIVNCLYIKEFNGLQSKFSNKK